MSSKTGTSAFSSSTSDVNQGMWKTALVSKLCRHFGECGGCSTQNLPYPEQLRLKKEKLESLLSGLWTEPVSIHPSPDLFYYRNKMEFSFTRWMKMTQDGHKEIAESLGLKRRGKWDRALDLEECLLLSPEAPGLLAAVRKWAREEALPYYDLRRHEGFLRHLVVREGKNTGQRMAVLVTSEGELSPSQKEGFVKAVLSSYPASTVLWGINRKVSDVATADCLEVLYGPGFMEEKLELSLSPEAPPSFLVFRISPYSFFQTNTLGAQKLYSIIREWAGRGERAADLYCGCGGISLAVAGLFKEVTAVESVESAVSDARFNSRLNGIGNVEFVCSKVEDFLPGLLERGPGPSTVILDPPRAGIHPKVLKGLLDFPARCREFESLIYVSCNPRAFSDDLKALAGYYKIDKIEAVDLFPHTDHFEVICKLILRS